MRAPLLGSVLAALMLATLSGCGSKLKAEPSAESFKADKVSPRDGVIEPDGKNDAAIDVTIEGPIASLIVMSVDDKGQAAGGQQWDTLVGNDAVSKASGSSFVTGASTWQLGVFDSGIKNNGAGSLASGTMGAGTHKLKLYLSDNNQLRALKYVVVAIRPDGSAVRSSAFSF